MATALTIKTALNYGIGVLSLSSESPKVDTEVLLCEVLQCNRSKLIIDPEQSLSDSQITRFLAFIEQRKLGHPVSYIIGHQDFWTLSLEVNESTLIPRPETELLVELAVSLPVPANSHCLDLGTGTGAIALAIASEKSDWQVLGCDRVADAVALAQRNKRRNNITNVAFIESHWFNQLPEQKFDVIVTNPPYVESNSDYLNRGDLRFEPQSALVAGGDGLDDIRQIIAMASDYLNPQGWLLIEHGFEQSKSIQSLLVAQGFNKVTTKLDYAGHDRVTMAQFGVA
ncbi:peptide chain release factor N(5)-glutamine methyltransferase [Planctobacterium marinum]|uniref:Release factor glutamine methyltransferase n=1 Tax=Planctobacterium marinum TaxID=1631968 RepID=A0AA48HR41_9ALTE|nr:release factor glutamine methyltransferase [Planctobacterium marinum]